MGAVFRIVKEVDGGLIKSVVLSEANLKLVMSGIFYAKSKDYHGPRKKQYDVVYSKFYEIVNSGVK